MNYQDYPHKTIEDEESDHEFVEREIINRLVQEERDKRESQGDE